jgi:hypothetical protein
MHVRFFMRTRVFLGGKRIRFDEHFFGHLMDKITHAQRVRIGLV